MVQRFAFLASWLVVFGFSMPASTGERAGESASAQPTSVLRRLVEQLGDTSYAVREEAAKRLVSHGLAAKGVLKEALDDADLEVRIRAQHILACVRQSELEARLAAFIADVDGREDHNLPGWAPYKELVGGSRDARKLFAEMIRSEASLLTAYEKGSADLPQLFAARMASMQPHVVGVVNRTNEIPAPTMATLLLIGADKIVEQNSSGMSRLYSLLNQPTARHVITAGKHASLLTELLEEWVTSDNSTVTHFGMMLVLKYDLKEAGLQQAKKVISRHAATSSSILPYAIIAVGKYGGEEHASLLESLLGNKTVCHTWTNRALKKDGSIKIQVRDVALAMILHVTGRDLARYGFKLLRQNPETLYYIYTFGFVDDKEREAAHAKWAEESKADRSDSDQR